ncbi:lipoyl(octanoyl) transferase LipB [Neptunomonas phycophila]|uniref:lipoyl(octanoyl) transferase LipB n=1 Tax=Neptunomonas phycophila TaxID=1572645 RepID=UPI0023F94CC3|nr:lipoyl(octanoyl) transferase LipB [Neptunomonas phycophila]
MSQVTTQQKRSLIVRSLGLQPYEPVFARMKAFNENRNAETIDEIWYLDHQPVFTQGQAGKVEHLLETGDIPVVQADRGGQVTYHGPGQLIVYLMLDLRRNGLGVRDVVTMMEQGVIATLAHFGVDAYAKPDAPGVYVEQAKVASLGLRVRRGCTFHGLAFNLDMDLSPFLRINPCGYAGMPMTQLVDLVPDADPQEAIRFLVDYLTHKIGYTSVSHQTGLD